MSRKCPGDAPASTRRGSRNHLRLRHVRNVFLRRWLWLSHLTLLWFTQLGPMLARQTTANVWATEYREEPFRGLGGRAWFQWTAFRSTPANSHFLLFTGETI